MATRKARAMRIILRFLADDSAAASIEYSLIAAGISITIITAVIGIGTSLNSKYSSVSIALN
jgi:pilus assembly protein Flp/PilA